jgi:branched-chain amino acid transport system substrate-binding protein
VIQAFPWVLTSGSPALNEYGQAIAQYDHNPTAAYSGVGWDAGKLLQAALTISLSKSPVPTSAGLLQALWTMHGETLGGLTPPLSFHQGKPASEVTCTYEVQDSGGKWVAPHGAQTAYCRP